MIKKYICYGSLAHHQPQYCQHHKFSRMYSVAIRTATVHEAQHGAPPQCNQWSNQAHYQSIKNPHGRNSLKRKFKINQNVYGSVKSTSTTRVYWTRPSNERQVQHWTCIEQWSSRVLLQWLVAIRIWRIFAVQCNRLAVQRNKTPEQCYLNWRKKLLLTWSLSSPWLSLAYDDWDWKSARYWKCQYYNFSMWACQQWKTWNEMKQLVQRNAMTDVVYGIHVSIPINLLPD